MNTKEAIAQMICHCKMMMEQGEYEAVSARGVLYTLGFEADADEILAFIASRGFDYCLDPMFGDHPSRFACYWGPDQLESRLQFIA